MYKKMTLDINKETGIVRMETFQVPKGTKRLTITVEKDREDLLGNFIMVIDSKKRLRMQKMLAYGTMTIGISQDAATTTAGGVSGEICDGEWILYYGCMFMDIKNYAGRLPVATTIIISDEETELTEVINGGAWMTPDDQFHINDKLYDWNKRYCDDSRWYKGDFHAHSIMSDGKESIENIIKKAKYMNMDYYVPTEHNLYHTGWCKCDMPIIPGVEITSYSGHYNIFGVKERPELLEAMLLSDTIEKMNAINIMIIDDLYEKGNLISINHPFLHIWQWHIDVELEKISSLEIINDPTYEYSRKANDKAIDFLDFLWADGHIIYGIGGSDSHNLIDEIYEGATTPSIAGDPGTYVYADGLSANSILDGVRHGHMNVTRFCEVMPTITGRTREYLPGDRIDEDEIEYVLTVSNIKETPVIYRISNDIDGRVRKDRITDVRYDDNAKTYTIIEKITMPQDGWHYVRYEVRTEHDEFRAYINPIFRGNKEVEYKTFNKAKKVWEETWQ
ncbi:MAG: PHP domain-containing protein [Lachnospiraceae bacterium]|nr:PHP domain-containing protein [Lachnospiraceae bacterium]